MSLVTLDLPTLQRRQRALFVVPADVIRAAADQNNWAAVCAALRVNALSCIKSAEHGWIGASFSCCEILAVLHLHPSCAGLLADSITLSKGHAAAMQFVRPVLHRTLRD
jgi:transketolase N-terminal domain/subunit